MPPDLGDEYIELIIGDDALPYLSRDHAKRLADYLTEVIHGRSGGKLEIGDDCIEVSRRGDVVILAGTKLWEFSIDKAVMLSESLRAWRMGRVIG
jgi:hypothetical protein